MDPRADLLAGCAVLEHEGLTTAFGHLSARVESGSILLSGNQGPGLVTDDAHVLEIDGDGGVLAGDPATLPGEAAIHLGILAARSDVASVCRFHGPAALAWSTLGPPLPATTGIGLFLGSEVPVFETASTIRTSGQGSALAECLGGGNAVLLRGFGAATVGRTVAEAVVRAWLLERSAAATLAASAAGQPRPYPPEAAAPFAGGEGPAGAQIDRAWRWLCSRSSALYPSSTVEAAER